MRIKNFIYYVLVVVLSVICTVLFLKEADNNNVFSDSKESSINPLKQESELHDPSHENVVELTEKQIKEIHLSYKNVEPGELFFSVSAMAKVVLEPGHLVHIVPKASGVAKTALKNIGDRVKAGDLLAVLESSEMADAKASYLIALSKQKLAFSVLEREKRLFNEKISPEQDLLVAKNALKDAEVQFQLIAQKLKTLGLNQADFSELANENEWDLGRYSIYSPIDGTVIMRHITKGELIDNRSTIYEVADLRDLWIEIGIYPQELPYVRTGQLVEILDSDKKTEAELIFVSPIISEETIVTKAIAKLSNTEEVWRPGAFLKVKILSSKQFFPLIISKEAVQTSKGKPFIFIVTPYGFEKRFIEVGLSDSENVEVKSGVRSGEKYVLNHAFMLKAELEKESAEHEH